MGPNQDDVYTFGPFRLDIPERLLTRAGETVPLEPTQFDVLAMLVRDAAHLVTREDLIGAVWKGTYVDEGSLTVTISLLRKKLGDTPSQPRYIGTVRKSGYRFVAPVTRWSGTPEPQSLAPVVSQPLTSATPSRPVAGGRGRVGVATMAALVVVLTGVYWSPSGVDRDPTFTPIPLYPFGGIQNEPSFSPDGSQVAFTWRPPHGDNHDIYVLKIGDLKATRLTSDPAWDRSPAWSPDGRQIAFIRTRESKGEILLISPAGGPEQKVVDTAGTSVTWSPDSQTLAFIDRASAADDAHSIFFVAASGGAKRRATFPAAEKTFGDSSPAISPDGRTLAFVRHLTYDVADVFVQPVGGGNARQLTFDKRQIRGLAWTAGRELLFSSNRSGRHQLWRVKVNRTGPPKVVEGITEARFPTVFNARRGEVSRLVFQSHTEDYNIRLLSRGADGAWTTARGSTFAASIRDEQGPSVSPDGGLLAFVSDRSGWFEVWVCAYPVESDCRQLTSFRQGYVGSPAWSPDSQRIVFDARVDGNADVYVLRADGGQPVRLTHQPSVESRPSWSRDGRSIYFRSDRTGAHQIWKAPVAGGTPIQVTQNGGFEALEAPDGKTLYYVKGRYTRTLWTVPANGGPETKVSGFGSLTASSWAIAENGIFWIDTTTANPPAVIRCFDFLTRKVSPIAEITSPVLSSATGFSTNAAGSVILWSQLDRSAHDLMVVDGFR